MFHEIDQKLLETEQENNRKLWFRDSESECDLFVWENEKCEIISFQFWHKNTLLQWDSNIGIRTGEIDQKNGGFTNFQSNTFSYHRIIDKQVFNSIMLLLKNNSNNLLAPFNSIINILHAQQQSDIIS